MVRSAARALGFWFMPVPSGSSVREGQFMFCVCLSTLLMVGHGRGRDKIR